MRVAIVTESFLPTVNGVTTSVARVLEHLKRRGHEALVIAPACGAPRTFAGAPVIEVPSAPYRAFPVGLPTPTVQRALADFGPDVLHAASPFLLGASAIGAAHRLRVPSVAVFQTDLAGYARRNRLAAASRFAWKVVAWAHDKADLTLAPSSVALADLERAGIARLDRWGRGVDLDGYHPRNRTRPPACALRERLAPAGELLVGYVGRLAPEKHVERLRVLAGLHGVRVVVVGDGPSMGSVRRELSGLDAVFLGQLTGEALADADAALDVFVHPGTEETFGQTIQEAQASGLPVVAPRAGGPIDLIENGVTGLLTEPEHPESIRDAVGALIADPPARARIGEAGRRAVLGRTWESLGDQLIAHYERTIARVAERREAPSLAAPR